ncbi:peptidoglycan binding protein CsiV [Idiomarina aminovorans]|uniref:peptidoglycan binding protein CsiV n=1 Tax=Idiomarina aminovorans TaxID=2914829 RepID=UPI002005454B|nr:peptidoglycan binding protein CsiV [Idiomarina sp. ATCH4]MCK7458327.1 peptidoglycan binding protein CsiV [Idiomarina sp. ATCH4]
MALVHRGLKSVLGLITALIALVSAEAAAQSGKDYWRWFEVEVLIFKQTATDQSGENFSLTLQPISIAGSQDLLTPHHSLKNRSLRSALPTCEPLSEGNWQLDVACQYENEDQWIPITGNPFAPSPVLSEVTSTAVVIDGPGGDIKTASQPFLMPEEVLELSPIRTQLDKKGQAKSLLHLAWRQPVFTRNHARKFRLFGGKNYSDEFFYNGFPREQAKLNTPLSSASQQQRMDNIESLLKVIDSGAEPFRRLNETTPVRPPLIAADQPHLSWEFDGLMQIFLVGNYLHINGEFNLRETDRIERIANNIEEQASLALNNASEQIPYLRSYYFSQLRRVISHETHYFDHPKLGVVVQIRRTDLSAPRY